MLLQITPMPSNYNLASPIIITIAASLMTASDYDRALADFDRAIQFELIMANAH